MRVNAWAAAGPSDRVEPFSYELRGVGDHEVLVEVERCGICRSDLHMMRDDWRMTKFPLVPGHEVVGRIVEVGRAVEGLKAGQRVGVGCQRSACAVPRVPARRQVSATLTWG
jgi:D-arabinose 1-dehydrogenase-like Zn-dependent alcohol dehydrogenase